MDAVLTAIVQRLPELSVGSVGMVLLVLLIRRESSTEGRHTAELDRVNAAHDAELVEKNAEIRELRARVSQLDAQLDEERKRRRKAEDAARRGGAT